MYNCCNLNLKYLRKPFKIFRSVKYLNTYSVFVVLLQEIQEKFNQLLEERQKLHSSWQHKKVHLDQLIDLHFFLRDSKQIDTLCSAQEAALSGVDFGKVKIKYVTIGQNVR